MTSKEYLRQIRSMEIKMDIIEQEIRDLKDRAISIQAIATDKEQIQTSPSGDVIAGKIAAYVDEEGAYANLLDRYLEVRSAVVGQILELEDDRYKAILYKRYCEGKRLDTIAEEMGYDGDWIRKLHGLALQKFDVVLNNTQKHTEKHI